MQPTRVQFTLRTLMSVVGVSALLIVGAEAIRRPAQPSAVIAGTKFQFGVMAPKTSGRHVWPITNDGWAPLQFNLVCSGSNCTIRGILNGRDSNLCGRSLTLRPGEKADVVMMWRTDSRRGPYKNYVQLGTSDPAAPIISLTVEGLIKP
jgi:hypothetical protein